MFCASVADGSIRAGDLQMRNRAVQIANGLEREAEPVLRNGQPRIQPDSFLQLNYSGIDSPSVFERESEVVTRFGVPGP